MRIEQQKTATAKTRQEQIISYCLKRFQENGDTEALAKINNIDNHVKDGYEFDGLTTTGMYRYLKKFKEGYQKSINIDATEAEAYKACADHAVSMDAENQEFREQRIKNQKARDEKLMAAVAAQKTNGQAINDTTKKVDEVIERLGFDKPD